MKKPVVFDSNRGLSFWLNLSARKKPDKSCDDYLLVKNENGKVSLLGWCLTYPQRNKPSNKYYFKRGPWYYSMGLITEFRGKYDKNSTAS